MSVGISNLSCSRNSLHNRKKPYLKNRINRIYGCSLSNEILGTVEMAQELRTLIAPPEDLDLVPQHPHDS